MNTILLVLSLAASASAVEPAASFLPAACPTKVSTAAWRRASNPTLRYSHPAGWLVADRLERWTLPVSTSVSGRLSVYLDYSLKGTTVPVLSLYGSSAPGKLGGPGVLLEENMASSRARGEDVLGKAGTFELLGVSSACVAGVIELNARRQCGSDVDAACRRPLLFVDCGAVQGAGLTVTALLPAYPERGKPAGKAVAALAEAQAFLCGLEYSGR